jgi:hypothetical protein
MHPPFVHGPQTSQPSQCANELVWRRAKSNGGAIKTPKKPTTTVEKATIIRILVAGLAACDAHIGPSNANATMESQLAA